MGGTQILTLGLALEAPWVIKDQYLDTASRVAPPPGPLVVYDMSQAFLSGVAEALANAEVMVDWFHIVQTFTKALDEVRKKERREKGHPKALRWAVLKNLDNGNLTAKSIAALQELVADQGATGDA